MPTRRAPEPHSVTQRAWVAMKKTRGGRFAQDTFSGFRAVVHGFQGERIALRAAALTYISIFSLVPLLTVALVLIQSLHQKQFQQRLLGFIHEVFAPGVREESAELFNRFIDRASSVTAGSIGFVMLLISASSLLRNLDASLNEIWRVRRKRPLHVRVGYYIGILILGPLLITLSLMGTAGIRALLAASHLPHWQQMFTIGVGLLVVATFTLVYAVAPNAPVRFRSAFAGGLVAGAAWEAARYAYADFGARIFQYNPIFGSLGEAPLFLAWIYTSWLVVLFGARLAYAVEYASYRGTYRRLGEHPRARELVATQIAQLITRAQVRHEPAPTPRELARRLDAPVDLIFDVVETLEIAGLVVVGKRGGLFPARHPDNLTVAELSAAVGGVISLLSHRNSDSKKAKEFAHLDALFLQIDQATVERLGQVTWSSLISPADATTEAHSDPQSGRLLRSARGGRRNP